MPAGLVHCRYLSRELATATPISDSGERLWGEVDTGPSAAAGEAMIRTEPRHNRRPAAVPRFGFRRPVTACLLFFFLTLRLPLQTVIQLSIPLLNSFLCHSPSPSAPCDSSAPLSLASAASNRPRHLPAIMSSAESPTSDTVQESFKGTESKNVNQTAAQLRSFAAGGAGGVCAVVVGHPFDLVKVRMQTAAQGVYSGAIDVVKKTIAREGLARVSS